MKTVTPPSTVYIASSMATEIAKSDEADKII
jgi:hypothetical protein